VLYLLFFFSGASALIYEVVWVRVFANVFGNTVYSASIVTAIFMLKRFTLTVSKSNVLLGQGTVTSSPSGINCGAACASDYVTRTAVTLTATPALGSLFTGWSGCDAVNGSTCTVTMTAGKQVTASFVGVSLF